MAAHLFRQYEALEEKEVGKAPDRGRRPALDKFGFLRGLLVVFPLLLLAQTAAAQGTWSPTGSMGTTRGGDTEFTLTRLCDGRVLAAGGHDGVGILASAELYDPASGTWTPTASMVIARYGHSATLLANCKVLVAGGHSGVSSAELYDPASGTWSTTGSLSTGRALLTAVLLNNGKVLVAAGAVPGPGDTFGTASAELYDPASGTWSPTGSLNTARYFQEGILLSDGRVLIAGGMPQGVTFTNFASAEVYDPASGTWSTTGSMAIGRRCCFTLTLLPSGKVLVAGGITNWTAIDTALAELYNPATGVWTPTSPLPATRNGHSATPLLDGTVLVAGGQHHPQDFGTGTCVNTAPIYNPVAQTWSPTANTMGEIRVGHHAVRLSDGRVLVAGGSNCVVALSTAELFESVPPDTTAPVVIVSFLPPPDGLNDWFVTSPVMGSVTANDTTTGGSNITAINCTGATVGTITGLGTPSASAPLTVSGEGVHNVSCTATDSAGNSGAATGSSNTATVMIDTVAPSEVLNPAADSCSLPGNAGWCRGTQTAGFSASDATSGVASPCSGASCNFTQSTTTNGSAVSIASGAVCDVAGNCNAGIDSGPYMIDSVAPSISIVSPANGGTYVLNATTASSYSCSDETSDVATCSGTTASGSNFSTSPVGVHAFTVNATDGAGNPNQATNTYNVIYNFSGFFTPVDNPGPGPNFVFNVAKAGSAIPVKFSLSGDQGLNIFATGSPASQNIQCSASSSMDLIEQTVTAGSSSLSYDATTDQYVYTWKTNKGWAISCRKLIVTLNDGATHVAYFNFTK